jgi:hypothetical protein
LFKLFVVVQGQGQVPGTSGFEGLAVILALVMVWVTATQKLIKF